MACFTNGCNQTVTTTRTTNNDNTIAGLLRHIEQMQRNAIRNNNLSRCDNCIINMMYNTKPIAIYLCSGARLEINDGEVTANLFRVEEVRGNDTVVLRLLETGQDGTIICTRRTFVMKIDCICIIQCFDPINCTVACFENAL